MPATLEATVHLRDENVKVQRVKDERTNTDKDHYFVINIGMLTIFADPVALNKLIKSLGIAKKRRAFDRTHKEAKL